MVVSDLAGNKIEGSQARYTPLHYAQGRLFGEYRLQPQAMATDRGFTGHRHNDELGLIYMNARYYLPSIGRFLTPDTLVPDPQNPQSFNRYSYGYNNPLKYIDPSGHIACEAVPMECHVDSQGNEDWTTGNQATEAWQETAAAVAAITVEQVITETPTQDLISGNTKWPSWTYSRLFPDYFIVQATLGPVSFALAIDDYSNGYFSLGGSLGPESIAASIRAAGGWIVAKQEASKDSLGLEWNLQKDSPTETLLENYLAGFSGGGGAGFIVGADGVVTLSNAPAIAGVEAGLYSPQVGIGAAGTLLFYDAGSSTPWFWQRLWSWGVP